MLIIDRTRVNCVSATQTNYVCFTSRIKITLSNANIYQALFEYAALLITSTLEAKKPPKVILSDGKWC